jgi:hypothetical protein
LPSSEVFDLFAVAVVFLTPLHAMRQPITETTNDEQVEQHSVRLAHDVFEEAPRVQQIEGQGGRDNNQGGKHENEKGEEDRPIRRQFFKSRE